MKKSRFTNEQIAFALKQAETGMPIEEVCRKLGVSQQAFHSQSPVDFRPLGSHGHLSQPANGSVNRKMLAVPQRSYS